jgi:hypothetical protein
VKDEFNTVYQFRIALQGIEPPIWRRIHIPEPYTFWDFHVAIQDAMGWLDCHLHEFRMINPSTGSEVDIGIPYEDFEKEIFIDWEEKIADYFTMKNRSAYYVYDFGDSWEHDIQLEKILPREDIEYPVCIEGRRACPPDDCGGVSGYEKFLKIIADPSHEEYEEMLEWVGEAFDPEYFDPKEVVFDDPDERYEIAFEI